MRKGIIGSLVVATWLLSWPADASGAPLVYVTDINSDTVLVIDGADDTFTGTEVPVGDAPSGVAVHPDGTRVYVANGSDDTVSVLDTATSTVSETLAVGDGPVGVAVQPDGTRVYVTNSSDDTVSIIETATNTVLTLAVGNVPDAIAVSPDGTRVYVTNLADNTVSVIDTAITGVTATVPVGNFSRGVAVHPDGTRVYVTNKGDDTVSVIDTATNMVTATVAVGDAPDGVAVHPDGTLVYVANVNADTISVIDTATNKAITTIEVGDGPRAVAVHPDGTTIYAVRDGTVTVIERSSGVVPKHVVKSIPVVVADGGLSEVAVDLRPSVSISINALTPQVGTQFTVTVSTTGAVLNQWFLIVALATPVNAAEDPFFVFRFDPTVELLPFQEAIERVGQGGFADIAARPLDTVATESFNILDIPFPAFPAGSYQWLAVLFRDDLSFTSDVASAAFTVK